MYFMGYIWQDTKTSMRSKMPQWSSTGPQAERYRYCRVDIIMALSLREAFNHCPSCDDTRSWSVSNQDRKWPNADTKLTIEAIWHRFCAGTFVLHIEKKKTRVVDRRPKLHVVFFATNAMWRDVVNLWHLSRSETEFHIQKNSVGALDGCKSRMINNFILNFDYCRQRMLHKWISQD